MDLGSGSEIAQDRTCGYVLNWDPFGFPNYKNFISPAVPLRMAFGNMASTSQRSQPDAMDDGDDEMDGFVNMLEAAAMNELQKIQ